MMIPALGKNLSNLTASDTCVFPALAIVVKSSPSAGHSPAHHSPPASGHQPVRISQLIWQRVQGCEIRFGEPKHGPVWISDCSVLSTMFEPCGTVEGQSMDFGVRKADLGRQLARAVADCFKQFPRFGSQCLYPNVPKYGPAAKCVTERLKNACNSEGCHRQIIVVSDRRNQFIAIDAGLAGIVPRLDCCGIPTPGYRLRLHNCITLLTAAVGYQFRSGAI